MWANAKRDGRPAKYSIADAHYYSAMQ